MTKPGRLPCVNPACRRTAPAEDHGESDVICRKCWKLLPQRLRDRDAQLRRREKLLLRLIGRRVARHDISPDVVHEIERRLIEQFARNWQLMRDYFRRPDKPVGLDGFLQEVGL